MSTNGVRGPLSLPQLVGGEGVLTTVPSTLDAAEREGCDHAGILREAIESLDLTGGDS